MLLEWGIVARFGLYLPLTRRPRSCNPPDAPTSLEVINKFKWGCPISRALCEKWERRVAVDDQDVVPVSERLMGGW